MDEITDDSIKNEAHKIIYKSIYSKFYNLLSNKKQFLDECDGLYKDALQKYKPKEEVTPSNDSIANPADKVELPKLEKFRASFYTKEKINQLLKVFEGDKKSSARGRKTRHRKSTP
ncbi:MAG: hypothetical protein K6G33_11940 [Ruminococcus sp.]|uniref:hypothetical protein n=1 Tax=Ruminococcus sp. TaxID=41978 RepID=UPI0025FAC2BE|nr:hypothetical protein [Ruminococcus sp.]MCR5601437.1 hypothetical protein [Ruminococcus sp.]